MANSKLGFKTKLVLTSIVGGAFFYCAATIGPLAEAYVNPVIRSAMPVGVSVQADTQTFRFLIDKARDCKLISRTWYFGNPQGVFQRVRLSPVDLSDLMNSQSLPVGLQYTDYLKVTLESRAGYREQFGVLVHECSNSLWHLTTILGPYPLPLPLDEGRVKE